MEMVDVAYSGLIRGYIAQDTVSYSAINGMALKIETKNLQVLF